MISGNVTTCLRPALALLVAATFMMPTSVFAFDLGGLTKGLLENAESIGKVLGNADTLLGQYSDEEERKLGQGAAAVLLGAAPLHPDERVQRYVNRVGAWLARHTERPDLQWRFAVLDSTGANAFAAPGGYVFITRDLVALLRNETELAGVLAHEMGHVLARHHLEAMTSQERFKLVTDVALSATDTKGVLSDALVGATRKVYSSGLEQGDEFEADAMGVVIAARAGYDAYGLTHVLKTIEGASQDPQLTGFFLGTHPPTSERLDRLYVLLDSGFPDARSLTRDGFAAMQARLRPR